MASCDLGKIFSVDEGKETPRVVDEDDDDGHSSGSSDSEEDDEEARERAAAFNKNKQKNTSPVAPVTGSNRSIRRYDEYGDFITRSERSRRDAKDEVLPPSTSAAKGGDGRNSVTGKGRVSFREETELAEVREIPLLSDDEKSWCFMTQENWRAIDTDIDVTTKRWNNHKEGRIKFDEDNNTIRGIEDMIFNIKKDKSMYQHRKAILEEVVRQKTETKDYPNWEKLRAISEASSASMVKLAVDLGKEDEKEKNRVWAPKAPEPAPSKTIEKKKKSRKGSIFGLFKKK